MTVNSTSKASGADAAPTDATAEKPATEPAVGAEVTVEGEEREELSDQDIKAAKDETAKAETAADEAAGDDQVAGDKVAGDDEPVTSEPEVDETEADESKAAGAEPAATTPIATETVPAETVPAEGETVVGETVVAETVVVPEAAADDIVADDVVAESAPDAGVVDVREEVVDVRDDVVDVTSVELVEAESIDDDEPVDADAEYDDAELAEDDGSALVPDRHDTIFPLLGTLLALAAVAALLVGAFAWPGAHGGPRKLPIGVAGTTEVTAQLEQIFTANDAKTFKVHKYTTEKALRSAIEHRKIYGGLSVNGSSATMFIASAASPTAADALNSVATGLSSQIGSQLPVTDLVPMPDKDPRGAGLASAELPLVLATLLPAIGLILLYRRRLGAQVVAAAGASVALALALAAVLNYVSGSTEGSNYWLLAAGLTLGVFATSALLLGLNSIGGKVGLGIGVALLVLVGAPLSGLSTAPEWIPDPWGKLGQLLPSGANATMLRSTAFFDGHGAGPALVVLLIWAVIGLALAGLGYVLWQPEPELEA
jgi:hypothetical protein